MKRIILTALFLVGSAIASNLPINPYAAKYDIYWRGIYAGQLEHNLTEDNQGYSFSQNSRTAIPFLPFRLKESSYFSWSNDHVVPHTYKLNNKEGRRRTKANWMYDWSNKQLKSERSTLNIQPGDHNPLTQSLAMRLDLMHGEPKSSYRVLYKGQMTDWNFVLEGSSTLNTSIGTLETIVVRQLNGDRDTILWLAPEHNYLLVRFEKMRRGKVDFAAQIAEYEAS